MVKRWMPLFGAASSGLARNARAGLVMAQGAFAVVDFRKAYRTGLPVRQAAAYPAERGG